MKIIPYSLTSRKIKINSARGERKPQLAGQPDGASFLSDDLFKPFYV